MQHHYYRPLLAGLSLFVGAIGTAQAQRFELDPSFDTDGRVTTGLTPPRSSDGLDKLYPQPNSKVIALGRSLLGGWVTVRYNADGSLDSSYGTNGVISYDLATQRPGTTFTLDELQLLPSGQLLAVGVSGTQGAILRFNADGTIDSGFGSNGLVIRPTAANESGSTFRAVQAQPDGKLVVVGTRGQRNSPTGHLYYYLLVKRYNSDGTPDIEYTTAFTISTTAYDDTEGYGLAIQPDGKLLVSARAIIQSQSKLAFVRLLPDGSPDNSFGTSGRMYTDLACSLFSSQILLLPSGKFVVNLNGVWNGTFAQFLPSGALDTSFGIGGVATFKHDNFGMYTGPYDAGGVYNRGELALQADGKIVVGGYNGVRFGLLRMNTNGTKDSSFGSNFDQSIATEFSSATPDAFYTSASVAAVLIQPDGKIVAGGLVNSQKSANDASNRSSLFALARYAAVVTNNLPNGVWNGSVSSMYENAQNWSNNVLPSDTTASILIPKAAKYYPVLVSAAFGRKLTVEEGATLTITPTGSLTTTGALTLNGLVLGDGTLRTRGLSAQRIAGAAPAVSSYTATLDIGPAGAQLAGPLNITQMLILNGPLDTNGQPLRLVSTNSTSAMVVNNTPAGVVTGDVIVERNINPALNLGKGYRHYSSPVSNASFSTLAYNGFVPVRNQAFNTAADPGSVSPYPNVFTYDETRVMAPNSFGQGWLVPDDALEPGRGYTLNTTSFRLGGSPVSFVGTLNNGPITRTLTAGAQNESGWNFVGNPYPAPIDWNQVALPAGIASAAYVFRSSGEYSGSYVSFVNGVGSGNIIPAMQGFFVRATQPSVALQFTNAARLTTNANPAFYRPTAETRPLLRLDLTAPGQTEPSDAAYVYFQQGATTQPDAQYDAYKLPNSNGAQLSTAAGATELSINGLPQLTSQGTSIALHAWVSQTGTYTLTAGQLLNFNLATPVLLEDKLTGTWHDLQQQPTYSFTVATANTALNSRFVLHFGQSRALASQPGLGSAVVNLFPNPVTGGQLHIQLSGLTGSSQKVDAQLYNTLGQVVLQQRFAASAGTLDAALPVQGLSKGVYTLRLTSGQQVSAHQVVIQE